MFVNRSPNNGRTMDHIHIPDNQRERRPSNEVNRYSMRNTEIKFNKEHFFSIFINSEYNDSD